ncbi:MAG TPA: efflux transporter outer membrane subunit [Brumimicrobium sp.]|nr:efflux transporter outer membrane subunit [Brumimicrobium sp.]
MKIRGIVIVLSSVLFVGCMPQRNYTPEKFDVPEEFRISEIAVDEESTTFDGDSLVYTIDSTKLAWKNYFQDERLVELINTGLKHNFDVRKALKRMEIYNLQFKQSKLELLPSINAVIANPNYQFNSKNFHSSASGKWYGSETPPDNMFLYRAQNQSGIYFNWEIDVWGKIRSQKSEQSYNYLATIEAKNAIQTQLVADIASGYYNLLSLYAQLNVAETNYELSKRTLRMVELQFESGNTTALAKQQTKSLLLATKSLIPKIKQQISTQENKLQFLTGKTADEIEIVANDFDVTFVGLEKNYSIPLSMVSYRNDVRKAENELWAANARVGVSQAAQYPKLSIDLGVGVNAILPSNWFTIPGALFGSIIGNLTQPIFNKKRLKTKFKQAQLEREIKEIEFQETVYLAINEISNLLTLMNALDKQIAIAEEQVTNSELTVSQSNLLFNSGYATYLEVINAQSVALESEIQLSELKEERLQLRVMLYKALGGGW